MWKDVAVLVSSVVIPLAVMLGLGIVTLDDRMIIALMMFGAAVLTQFLEVAKPRPSPVESAYLEWKRRGFPLPASPSSIDVPPRAGVLEVFRSQAPAELLDVVEPISGKGSRKRATPQQGG